MKKPNQSAKKTTQPGTPRRNPPTASLNLAPLLPSVALCGCANQPVRGDHGTTTRNPSGALAQTISQGQNRNLR